MNDIQTKFVSFWQAIVHQMITVTPKVVVGMLIFLVAWLIAFIVKKCIIRLAKHAKHRLYLYRILGSLAMGLILCIGVITALGTMGVNVGALVASLGLAGFAVSFALKDTLSNMLAGFIVLFYQPFRVGDYITVTSVEGRVVDVNLRYTVVRSEEKHTFVPNATMLSSPLTVKDSEGELVNE